MKSAFEQNIRVKGSPFGGAVERSETEGAKRRMNCDAGPYRPFGPPPPRGGGLWVDPRLIIH